MREPCCSVGYTGSGNFPKSVAMWVVTWLPKGYGPSLEDKFVCAFPDQRGAWDDYSVRRGERPPLIEAVCATIEQYMRENPDADLPTLEHYAAFSASPPATP